MNAEIKIHPSDRLEAAGGDPAWGSLYRIGGAAALILLAMIPVGAVPFLLSARPVSVDGWFMLLQKDRLLGLGLLDIPNLVVNIVGVLLYPALFIALRRTSQSFAAVAATLGILAACLYVTTNPAVAMLFLNDQYWAATGEAQRSMILSAGQTVLTLYQSSTAFTVSYIFGAMATLILSAIMLRSKFFGKAPAYAGILASLVTLGLFLPKIGLYISIFSLLPYGLWLILVARRLFQMGSAS